MPPAPRRRLLDVARSHDAVTSGQESAEENFLSARPSNILYFDWVYGWISLLSDALHVVERPFAQRNVTSNREPIFPAHAARVVAVRLINGM
jgi:hypothetical protein